MKLTKYMGSALLAKELDAIDLLRIIKTNMPVKLVFFNVKNAIQPKDTIKIGMRNSTKPASAVEVECLETTGFISIDKLFEFINERRDEGLIVHGLYDVTEIDDRGLGELLTILPKISDDLIQECAYIDYDLDSGKYTLAYFDLPNGASNKVLFYESNCSLLTFTEIGPRLLTDQPGITSVLDLLTQ